MEKRRGSPPHSRQKEPRNNTKGTRKKDRRALTLTAFFACKKESIIKNTDTKAFSIETNGNIVTVKNLPADTIIGVAPSGQPVGAGKYSFFSLENNAWVSNNDSATTKWDLAFAGSTIRVNNQTSGPGNGGAFVFVGVFGVEITAGLFVDAGGVVKGVEVV